MIDDCLMRCFVGEVGFSMRDERTGIEGYEGHSAHSAGQISRSGQQNEVNQKLIHHSLLHPFCAWHIIN